MIFKIFAALLWSSFLFGQDLVKQPFSIDANFYYGSILEHNSDISGLITRHPNGFIMSYNKMTYGAKVWEARYNYPDYGASVVYHNSKNDVLGNNFGIYGHFNFYFLRRNLMLRIGQGVALAGNPYDVDANFENNAYGSKLLSSTFLMFNYKKANILDKLGVQAGLSVIHYSNANVRAPNASTNSLTFNIGLNYQIDRKDIPDYIAWEKVKFKEPYRFNLVLRGGISESDYIGLGQQPFLVVSTFIDKRINPKSTLQAGADLFLSGSIKSEIEYLGAAFGQFGSTGEEDWKRAGIFVGHELRFNKLAFVTQVGYYVYYPFDFEGRVYFRGGLKRYLTEQIFLSATLKSHFAKAEAVEFGLGIRL